MKRVLVVDDNKVFRESLSEYLSSKLEGYTVLTAEDGKRAIEILESNPVSLIMTDLSMPNVDGYFLFSYAKEKYPSIPVIIMTGTWSLDLIALVHKMEHVQYLEKPLNVEEMDRKVMELLEKFKNSSATLADF